MKEIDPGLHSLQAEVGGDIGATYPYSDPVALVCNDEGKLIGLDVLLFQGMATIKFQKLKKYLKQMHNHSC